MSVSIPGVTSVYVPSSVTVHLGLPDENAENVTVSFLDYVKNVASSELYPTWPENALRANIYAIISIIMNRVFTEWYRTKGYNFDITNTTQFDQSYVHNREIYDTVSNITDQIFDNYLTRQNLQVPLFTTFCDGREVQCEGLSQWGTVNLANQGYTPYEILKYYFGEDISIIQDVPLRDPSETYPGLPLELGDSSPLVLIVQITLNTIATNYPAIPKIPNPNGNFNAETEEAVRVFQETFNLTPTGIVDKATWYRIRGIYIAVTDLAELTASAISLSDIPQFAPTTPTTPTPTPEPTLAVVASRTQIVQYFLNVLSAYYASIPTVDIDGVLGPKTRSSLIEFQKTFDLPQTGIIDEQTYSTMYNAALGILETLPVSAIALPALIFPGTPLRVGSEGPEVYLIQQYLNYIASVLEGITLAEPDGIYGPETEAAVRSFQEFFGINVTGVVDQYTWNRIILIYRNLRFGNINGEITNGSNGTAAS